MAAHEQTRWEPVQVGGENLSWAIVDGMVQVRLPFRVNREKLSRMLQQQDYHVSDDVEETDALGWGRDYDAEGYYPYWVFPDDEQPQWTIFSYPPEDYDEGDGEATGTQHMAWMETDRPAGHDKAAPGYRPYLGNLAREELGHWLGLLRDARS